MRLILLLLAAAGCSEPAESEPTVPSAILVFTVENVSVAGDLGGEDVLYAPGVWAAHTGSSPLFTAGSPASPGLEALAEDGMTSPMLEEARAHPDVVVAGTFGQVMTGVSYDENPIGPGTVASFQFRAEDGQRLSLATMFIQSNDVFLGTGGDGMALFDEDGPRLGTFDADLQLWDAGTEVNEAPGAGPNQPFRQAGPDTGPAQDGDVTALTDNADGDGFTYPAPAATVRFSIALEPTNSNQ